MIPPRAGWTINRTTRANSIPRFITQTLSLGMLLVMASQVATGTGIQFVTVNIPAFTAVTGTPMSAAWADYDNDGRLDLMFASQGRGRLMHQLPNGSFESITDEPFFSDFSTRVGVAWGDIDNDGDLDLLVANDRGENEALYRNMGNGHFQREVGTPLDRKSTRLNSSH